MWILLMIACSVLNNAIAIEYECSPGWKMHTSDDGKVPECVRFYNYEQEYRSAQRFCEDKQGYLAIIKDEAKRDFVQGLFLEHVEHKYAVMSCWLGHQVPSHSSWSREMHFADGTKMSKPNFYGRTDKRCGEMEIIHDGTSVTTDDCDRRMDFVCERPARPKNEELPYGSGFGDPTTGCSIGWTYAPSDHTCVKPFVRNEQHDGETFFDARKFCQNEKGDLVQIDDEAKDQMLEVLSKSHTPRFFSSWIGVFKEDGRKSPFKKSNGSEQTFFLLKDKNLGRGPSCILDHMYSSREDWKQKECSKLEPFVCERQASMDIPRTQQYSFSDVNHSTGCLPGWTHYKRDRICLKAFSDSYGETYTDALSICQGYHGYLVQIQDEEKNSVVYDFLMSEPMEKVTWIATWKPHNETYDLYYNYKKKFVPSTEMSDNDDRTKCRIAKSQKESPVWDYTKCKMRKPFVCERPEIHCPEGWAEFVGDKSCIKVENDRKLSWHDAQSVCQQEGGDLFLPIKGDKANFVIDFQKKNTHYWIGFADKDEDGHFHLVNGGNMDKTLPWQRREPNNAHGNEHCGEMKDGLLYDKRCGKKRNFVCELFVGSL